MISTFSDIGVLVVGDAMLDRYFDGAVEALSPEAPVPVLKHRASRSALGGAANVATTRLIERIAGGDRPPAAKEARPSGAPSTQ